MSEQNDKTADGCKMLTATSDPVVLYQALCGATDEIEQLKRERDEAKDDLEFRRELYRVQENYLELARRERDEARAALREAIRFRDTSLNGYDLNEWMMAAGLNETDLDSKRSGEK